MASDQKRLTIEDPVGKEVLEKLSELETAEIDAALQIVEIRHEEIKLLAVSRRVKDERNKLFEKLLMERGLAPTTRAIIDQVTGRLSLVRPGPIPQAGAQEASPVSQPATPPTNG